jgi:hypothetical protein
MDIDKIIEEHPDEYTLILEREDNIHETHKIKTIKSIEEHSRIMAGKKLLMINTNLSFIDISKTICKKYNIPYHDDQIVRDLKQYEYGLVYSKQFNKTIDEVKERYTDDYYCIQERMMIRIELYKEGWEVYKIEKYIRDNITKDYSIQLDELNLELCLCLYSKIAYNLGIEKGKKDTTVGRPKLPDKIREYINNRNKEKMKNNMRSKYKDLERYEKVKYNLLTSEEFNSIKEKIEDENILKKLENLIVGN